MSKKKYWMELPENKEKMRLAGIKAAKTRQLNRAKKLEKLVEKAVEDKHYYNPKTHIVIAKEDFFTLKWIFNHLFDKVK